MQVEHESYQKLTRTFNLRSINISTRNLITYKELLFKYFSNEVNISPMKDFTTNGDDWLMSRITTFTYYASKH